ncbi:MAG: bifunctional serine/threonine-protein kinase/formylglycine-generating enzyme family protein [Planctomycetota bacterium]
MRVCPICEGYTATAVARCGTCDVPLVDVRAVSWPARDEGGGSPWIGHVVGGKYRITGVLGRGGMGTVYRAVHELAHSPTAVKVLHARYARQPAYREALMAEARRASRVRGDRIAQVLDVGETREGSIFIAMELVEGETLQHRLELHGSLSPGELLVLLEETCLALEGLERGGVVHRDISPSNLMLTRRGRELSVKLLDLGVAHLTEEPSEGSPTRLWVNPPYTAPEILRGERGNTRSDLYSLGVVAYQALCGRLPHGDGTTEERVRAVLEDEAEPLRPPRHTPRALVDLVSALMRREPEARPAGPDEVLQRIRRIREPHGPRRRTAAFGAFVGGLLLFTVSFMRSPQALLEGRPGGIALTERAPGREEPARPIKAEALASQVFGARGVDPDGLVLRCLTADGRLQSFAIRGRLADGELRFEADRDEGWGRFAAWAAEVGGEMTLSFQHRGRDLAHAKLFVDRRAPRLVDARLEDAAGERAFLARTRLVGSIDEDGPGGRVKVRIEVLDREGTLRDEETLPMEGSYPTVQVDLARYFPNLPPLPTGGSLRIVLEDAAGRTSQPWVRTLDRIDVSVPEIERILTAEGGSELLRSGESFEVRLRVVGGPPADLAAVEVRADRGVEGVEALQTSFDVDNDTVRLHISVPELGDRRKLLLSFQLVDQAGNRSKELDKQFDVTDFDLAPRFVVLPFHDHVPPSRFVEADGARQLHWSEPGTQLRYTCNRDYEPFVEVEGKDIRMLDTGAGACTLELGPALDPELLVEVRHRTTAGRRPQQRTTRLLLVRHGDGPSLASVPEATAGDRWTGELVAAGLLERVEGRPQVRLLLRKGFGRAREAGDRSTATLWRRVGGAWQPVCPVLAEEPVVQLDRGRNRLALEVRDLLGRELRDRRGALVPVDQDGHRLLPLLDFRHDDSPPRFPDALVEHGRDVRLRVELEQAFAPGTLVKLAPAWQGAEGEDPIQMRLEAADGGSLGTAVVSFARVQRWCGFEGMAKEGFGARAPVERRFRLATPAGTLGAAPVPMRFQPTSSLLSARTLQGIAAAAPSTVVMVPFLAPRSLALGVPRGEVRRWPGTLAVEHALEVTGLSDFFLGDHEVTRGEYLAFVAAVAAGDVPEDVVAALGHHEDPLGARRFTRAGLAPTTTPFGGATLEELAKAAADRPVTGVDWFQAAAYCRWLSWKVFGSPDYLRLPFAGELVAAAMHGLPPAAAGLRLNGLRPEVADLVEQRWKRVVGETARDGRRDPALWPLEPAELVELGDLSRGLGRPGEPAPVVTGLDFGVREWVDDLPFEDEEVAALIVANHENHRATAEDRRLGRLRTALPKDVLRDGIVRGLGFGEPEVAGRDPVAEGWLDDLTSADPKPARLGDPGLLGVRRSLQLARDGSLAGRRNPIVAVVGFRVAGTVRFLEQARRVE